MSFGITEVSLNVMVLLKTNNNFINFVIIINFEFSIVF